MLSSVASQLERVRGLKVRTSVKAGGLDPWGGGNHNRTVARLPSGKTGRQALAAVVRLGKRVGR
jgi:hypothetical protein